MKSKTLSAIRSYLRRALPVGQSSNGSAVGLIGYDRGTRYGIQDLARSYRTSPILRDVTSKIAFSVATVRWKLYRANKLSTVKILSGAADCSVRRSYISELAQSGELKEIPFHRFHRFWDSANPYMTGLNARKLTQLYLDLPGEAFWILKYDKSGYPEQYWPIPPHWVKSVPEKILELDEIRDLRKNNEYSNNVSISYRITIGAQTYYFAQDEVVWMRELDLEDPYGRGSGIGYTLGDEIETNEYASKFLKSYFINSGRPEMIFSVEKADEPSLKRAEANYNNKFNTFWNSAKTFWASGKIDVKELTGKLIDMDVINLRKSGRDATGTVFGVPPELRAIVENSNRATIDSALYLYNKVTVVPRLEFQRAELQEKVLPLFDDNLIVDYVSPVPEDKEYELNVMKSAPYSVTRGEWRQRAGLQSHNESDNVYLQQSNLDVYDTDGNLVSSSYQRSGEKSYGTKTYEGISPLDLKDVENLVDSIDPELLTEYTLDYHSNELSKWGQSQLDSLAIEGLRFDLQNPVVQAHLKEYSGIHIKNINDTTRVAIRSQLLEGVKRGEGIRDLKKRVSSVMDNAKGYRAERIARTEVVSSTNFGSLHSYKESGVVEKKKWLAIVDGKTRTTHIDKHAEKAIPIDDYFVIGTDRGLHPGGFAKAENNCNCRCTMQPVTIQIPLPKHVDENAFVAKYLAFSDEWEAGLQKRFARAFNEQERNLLKKMERMA